MVAELVVGEVGLVLDLDAEFEMLEVADAGKLDVEVRLEVAAVVVVSDKFLEFGAESEDVLHLGSGGDVESEALLHDARAADVLDPKVVGDVVWIICQ